MVRRIFVALSILALTVALGGTASAGPDTAGQAIAFARINGSDGSLSAVGGKGTSSVSAVKNSTGDYTVTFNGHYPKSIANDSLILNSTAETSASLISQGEFSVSQAVAISASPTQIVVEVDTWSSAAGDLSDNNSFLTVFYGRP